MSPLLSNFPLGYAIRSVQVNQEGLKLHGTHRLLVYAATAATDDDDNITGGAVHTIKKNAEASVFASKETGLAINAYKTT